MTAFSGFPRRTTYTPVPNPFFGPLLEQITDLAELKVTLRGLWLLHRQRRWPRMVSLEEFLNDRTLLRGLDRPGKDPAAEISRGLRLAVDRGTLLAYRPPGVSTGREFYLLHTESDRAALARWQEGGPPSSAESAPPTPEPPGEWADRPNVFALYEENIGMLSPILAEELKEAEELYPWEWLKDAIQIAVNENQTRWGYVAGILRRWAAEGRGYGKPGRHLEKDNRQKYLADYERRWGHPPGDPARR